MRVSFVSRCTLARRGAVQTSCATASQVHSALNRNPRTPRLTAKSRSVCRSPTTKLLAASMGVVANSFSTIAVPGLRPGPGASAVVLSTKTSANSTPALASASSKILFTRSKVFCGLLGVPRSSWLVTMTSVYPAAAMRLRAQIAPGTKRISSTSPTSWVSFFSRSRGAVAVYKGKASEGDALHVVVWEKVSTAASTRGKSAGAGAEMRKQFGWPA